LVAEICDKSVSRWAGIDQGLKLFFTLSHYGGYFGMVL
jgi:hypothetical protein